MRLWVLVLIVAIAGCFGTTGRDIRRELPPAECDAWDECASFVSAKGCPHAGDLILLGACGAKLGEQYANLPSTSARRAYLLEAGRPSPVVAQYFGP